jgi:hypothetical protein
MVSEIIGGRQVARVEFLPDDDARILADFPIELAVADIQRVNAGRAMLEQAIGEPARGRADVHAD